MRPQDEADWLSEASLLLSKCPIAASKEPPASVSVGDAHVTSSGDMTQTSPKPKMAMRYASTMFKSNAAEFGLEVVLDALSPGHF
jgi:hypothetical protein